MTGTIDIRTRNLPGADYTVQTTQVLKGTLPVPALIVIRQEAAVAPLIAGASYLLFLRFDPQVLRYIVVNVIATDSAEFAGENAADWSRKIALAACGWSDIVVWEKGVYVRAPWNAERRYVPRAKVGSRIGALSIQDTSADACRTDLADGSASQLGPGQVVQRLKATDPRFRIVVRDVQGNRRLYQVIARPGATTGTDVLELDGAIVAATLSAVCVDASGCDPAVRAIEDVSGLTDLLARSPVTQGAPFVVTDGYRLVLDLADGSQMVLPIEGASGVAANGITVSVDQLMAIADVNGP